MDTKCSHSSNNGNNDNNSNNNCNHNGYTNSIDDVTNNDTNNSNSIKDINVMVKGAAHGFQVPTPNSPRVNHRRVYSRILVKVCGVAMETRLVKNKT